MTTPTDTELEDLLRTTFETYAAHPDSQRAQALAATIRTDPPASSRRWAPVLLAAGVAGALVLGGGVVWSQMRPPQPGASGAPTSSATRGANPALDTPTVSDPEVIARAEVARNRAGAEAAVEQLRQAAVGRLPRSATPVTDTIASGESLQSGFENLIYRARGLRVDLPVADVLTRVRSTAFPGMAPSDDSSYELPDGTVAHFVSFQRAGTAAYTSIFARYTVVPDGGASLVKVEAATSWRPGGSAKVDPGSVLGATVHLVAFSGTSSAQTTRELTRTQIATFVAALNSWYPQPAAQPRSCPMEVDHGSSVVLTSRHWSVTLTPESCSGGIVATWTVSGGVATTDNRPHVSVTFLEDWARLRAVLTDLGIR